MNDQLTSIGFYIRVQFVLTANSELHEPEAEEVEDEAEKHNVTHALLSSIRRKP